MSDPTFGPEHYLMAYDLLRAMEQDLAIHFQTEGTTWNRETMQNHVNDRAALMRVQALLLDAGEQIAKGGDPE